MIKLVYIFSISTVSLSLCAPCSWAKTSDAPPTTTDEPDKATMSQSLRRCLWKTCFWTIPIPPKSPAPENPMNF